MQRCAPAHELHRLEQAAERPAGHHQVERLVAVHQPLAERGPQQRQARRRRTARAAVKARSARRCIGEEASVARRCPRPPSDPRPATLDAATAGCSRRSSTPPAPGWPAERAPPRRGDLPTRRGVLPPGAARGARRPGRRARPLPGRPPAGSPRRGAARRPRRAAPRRLGALGLEPATYPGGARFAVALTHDIDTPWRWTRRACSARPPAPRAAALRREPREAAREAAALALAPVHRLRGTDPNWSFAAMARIERARGFASTSFVLAGHHDPHDGAAPEAYAARRAAVVGTLLAQGDEVGLHASYTAGEHPEPASPGERQALDALAGVPVQGSRFHYLRLRWHQAMRELDALGLDYDSSLGYAERVGPARRPLLPVPSLGRRPRRAPAPAAGAAGADGRHAGRGALPRPRARRRAQGGRAVLDRLAAPAAPARCCGTTTASTGSTAAAGATSTAQLVDGWPPAAAGPGRRRRSRRTGGRERCGS